MKSLKCLVKMIKLFLAKKYTDLKDIANSYTRVSENYNKVFLGEMHKYNKEMLDKLLIKYIDNNFNTAPNILDLACGTGFNSKFVNSKFSDSNFTLVDISEGMLKEAKDNCKLQGKFIKSDMLSFLKKCKDNTFDIVICGWAIKYQNPHEIIKEVSRVLKKDGYSMTLDKAKSLKEAGLFGVGISIDSLYKENHDKKRGYKGAFEKAISAIKNCKESGLYTMSQTVCTKKMLESGEIYELGKFLKSLEVDEVRILEPIPCGSLLVKPGEIFTKEDKKELINLHVKFNKDKQYPKTSVFPYVESKDQFGCGAGVQHSYIDNEGNFLPCDFVPEAFGNVLKEDINDIWNKMHSKLEKAKTYCYAKKCDKCNDEELPKYYRLLKGEK